MRKVVMSASLAALALCPAEGQGEELLSLPGTGAVTRVQRLEADGSQTNLLTELGVAVTPRAVLPSRDGTDLLIFGCDGAAGERICFGGSAYYYRVGRTGTASDPLGPYQSGVLLDRVALPGVVAVPSRVDAAWAGPRHVAVITGDSRVYFYDTAGGGAGLLSAAAPDGWAPTPAIVNLPGTYFSLFLAATPDRVYVSDGSSRLQIVNRGAAAPVECLINGGNVSDAVTALTALPDGRAVAALNNSRVAVIPAGCGGGTGAISMGNDTALPFEDLGALTTTGGRVYGSGGTTGSTSVLTSWSAAGSNLLDQRLETYGIGPGGVFEPFGLLAATLLSGTPTLVVAGPGGYRLRTFNGSGYPSVGSIGTEPAAAAVVAPPSFAVDRRLLELRGGQNLLELFGAAGKTLRVFPGSCRQTNVTEVREVMGGYQIGAACGAPGDCASGVCSNQQCAPALAAGMSSAGRYLAPGAGRALLAFTQSGTGEDCHLVLACDPTTPACAQGGGGAVLRVRGGARALSLVLDRSGSMNLQVGVSDPMAPPGDPGREIRAAALQYALTVFNDALAAVPLSARAGSLFAVVPFDDRSRTELLPAMGAWTGDDLIDPANLAQVQMRLAPRGATNIRGALRTAAERMTTGAFAAVQDRSVLLLTDGLHNRVGNAVENDDSTKSDPVGNLTNVVPFLKDVSWSAAALPRVNRLYAVGLAQSSQHPALLDLVRQTNSSSSGAALPPGYLNYADAKRDLSAGNQLAQFFTKVLWDYLGATEFLDPIDTFVNRGESKTYDIDTQGSVELAVLVAWQGSSRALRPLVTLTVDGKPVSCNGNSSNTITCYLSTLRVAGATKLTVTKSREAPLAPQQILVEAAGRSLAAMVPQQPKKVHRSGENIVFQVRLQERGLPLTGGATVTGKLVRPTGALGTVLARAQVSASEIKRELERVSDQSAAAAKFNLLPRAQVPAHELTDLTLRDDGKSGDGQAGDGVFGALVPASLPGVYELVARGTFDSRYLGQRIVREASLSTQVVVAFSLDKSLQKIEAFTLASKERKGSITLQLIPQDDRGNLLGPGASDTIVFRQRGRALPAAFSEPESLDGSYGVVVSEVDPVGAVEITGIGVAGRLILWADPTKSPVPEAPMCKDGCCCDLRPHQGAEGAARVALVAGLVLLALARRRRRYPS